MKLSEAIAAIENGAKVQNRLGSVFWLDCNSHGRPVLMGRPAGYGKEVKHIVFSSQHFDPAEEWYVVE